MKDYHIIHATALFINDLDIFSLREAFAGSTFVEDYIKIYEDNINIRQLSKHHAMVYTLLSLDEIHLKLLLDYFYKYDSY